METEAQLYRHAADKPGSEGQLIDAIALQLPPQSEQSFKFDIPDSGLAELEVRLTVKDALEVDNRAFAIVGNARKVQVLAITRGNRYLLDAFNTPTASNNADVRIATPEEARGECSRERSRGQVRPGHLRRGSPRNSPGGQCDLFRVVAAGPGLCESQGGRAAGDPGLEHFSSAHAVHS